MCDTETCEGCCETIYDKYVMRVSDSSWHEDCLFCSVCQVHLSNSCYFKDGRLYCRADYERQYGIKCGRCGLALLHTDLVMRTVLYIYHMNCFVCTVCCQPLQRGDQYVIRSGQIICRSDFEKELYMLQQGFQSGHEPLTDPGESPIPGDQRSNAGLSDDFVIEGGSTRQRDGRRGPKRPRTILTAAQRRQFKASFEVSPKPCRKVREALAKDTGLSVRVVQVWFQNQRAKMKKIQRRGKFDPKKGDVKKNGKKEPNEGDSGNSGDGYCDSEASLDEGAYDNMDEIGSPDTSQGDILEHKPDISDPLMSNQGYPQHTNPIDKLYLMQDSYFTQI